MTGRFDRRLRATFIHTLITLLLILALLGWLMSAWYSPLMFTNSGGWHGVAILFVVAIVSGPLLTYIVCEPDKKRHLLAFDLACIAMVQILGLGYGAHVILDTRPVVMAYWNGQVYPVTAAELAAREHSPVDLSWPGGSGPSLVYVGGPENEEERRAMVEYAFTRNLGEPSLAFLYEPIGEHLETVFSHSVEKRSDANPAWLEARRRYMRATGAAKRFAFIPYRGRNGDMLLVIDRAGRVADAIAVSD